MKIIHLECLLMPNGEILFRGKSLGHFTEDDLKKCAFDPTDTLEKRIGA